MKQNKIINEVFSEELKQINKGVTPQITNNKLINLLTKMKKDNEFKRNKRS